MSGDTRHDGGPALRVVVVGAGVTGLLAAIRCVQAGHRVVLLERGPIPNPGATSFDQHRALRALVAGEPGATSRASRLHHRWRELDDLLRDHRSGGWLYRRVGVLTALPAGEVAPVVATAEAAGLPIRIVDPAEYPHVVFPVDATVVLEPRAGVLLADRVLAAAARWLRRHPLADLRPGETVIGVLPGSGRVLLAGGGVESGDVVLVTTGPWSSAITDLPVTLHRQTMVYLRPPPGLARRWAVTPVAGGLGADGQAWLLPPVAGTALKISTDTVRRAVSTQVEPDDDTDWAAMVLSAVPLSDVDSYDVVRVRHCHYATSADGGTGFVRVGPSVWARPASGGDGFRTAPDAVDAVVADLAGRTAGIAASTP